MLIRCKECSLQVSDKALSCPHCGCPLVSVNILKKKPKKRLRLPNGFGQITELKNQNLRKPFRAMITVGHNAFGKPISKLLKPVSYFETYEEAYEALMEYNRDPYTIRENITLKELYSKWSEEYFRKLSSDSSIRTITSAWAKCSELYNTEVSTIRPRHLKDVIYKDDNSANIKSRIKSLFNLLFDYALENEIIDKNYARTFSLNEKVTEEIAKDRTPHIPFEESEINKISASFETIPGTDIVYIQCYTGWRPQELCDIRLENIDLINWTIKGGMKTKAGKNCIVPIHENIKILVEKRYKEAAEVGSEFLFNTSTGNLTYQKYKYLFKKIVDELKLNPKHRTHDPRVHFVTLCKKYQVDEYAIKYMVGHSISDITEKIYTKREIDWLTNEISKIKEPYPKSTINDALTIK